MQTNICGSQQIITKAQDTTPAGVTNKKPMTQAEYIFLDRVCCPTCRSSNIKRIGVGGGLFGELRWECLSRAMTCPSWRVLYGHRIAGYDLLER